MRRFSANVKAFVIADGFYYAGYSVLNAFLSLLIVENITGGRIDLVGYAISYYMLVRAIAEIPISRLTGKLSLIQKRNIIVCCYIVYGVLIFMLGQSVEIWHVFVIQTFLGLLDATAYPIKWTLFTKILDRGNESLEWGLEDITSMLLPALFTALAGFISSYFGLHYAFTLFAVLMIISAFGFMFLKKEDHSHVAA